MWSNWPEKLPCAYFVFGYGFRCLILIWECLKQIECTIIMDEVSV